MNGHGCTTHRVGQMVSRLLHRKEPPPFGGEKGDYTVACAPLCRPAPGDTAAPTAYTCDRPLAKP